MFNILINLAPDWHLENQNIESKNYKAQNVGSKNLKNKSIETALYILGLFKFLLSHDF